MLDLYGRKSVIDWLFQQDIEQRAVFYYEVKEAEKKASGKSPTALANKHAKKLASQCATMIAKNQELEKKIKG
ncbi:hypothetical protein [Campylobacter sp.]|uniref:hypothetical protein n=1 Tax=Campylobacter sp. TaxID=205 RepID=UPI002A80804B|nr:hypothetical protein [Campylobacter sp.]MDY4445328.1 hypothetical protein [Campylobacter sp.]